MMEEVKPRCLQWIVSQPLWHPRHCAKNLGAKVIKNRHSLIFCMIRPLKMAALLLSAYPLLDQSLLHFYPTHLTDLPSYLPQTAARDCSSWGGEGRVPLLVSLVTNEPIRCDSPITGNPQTHPQWRLLPRPAHWHLSAPPSGVVLLQDLASEV